MDKKEKVSRRGKKAVISDKPSWGALSYLQGLHPLLFPYIDAFRVKVKEEKVAGGITRTTFEYYDRETGALVKKVVVDDYKTGEKTRETYIYGPPPILRSLVIERFLRPGGGLSSLSTATFDATGKLIESIDEMYDPQGRVVSRTVLESPKEKKGTYLYEYDPKGRLKKVTGKDGNLKTFIEIERVYNADDSFTQTVTDYSVNPPATTTTDFNQYGFPK